MDCVWLRMYVKILFSNFNSSHVVNDMVMACRSVSLVFPVQFNVQIHE